MYCARPSSSVAASNTTRSPSSLHVLAHPGTQTFHPASHLRHLSPTGPCGGAARSLHFSWHNGKPLTRRRACVVSLAALEAAQPGKTVLGFVGIGIMGLAMCHNLIKAGYQVVVWNRNPDKCAPLVAAGAQLGATPRDVAKAATFTFAMVSDPAAALAVATGPHGVAAGLSAGRGYVDVSTVDSATSATIASAVRDTGAAFLEAPVSGSKAPAEQGKLIFLTAGDRALYDAVSGPLDAMGKARFFLGDVGAGANMKLVVNMMLGSVMASLAEGLALAGQVGLQQSDVVEVLGLGALASPMISGKGPAMVSRHYPAAFPLKHQQKDLRLVLELAQAKGQSLPVAAAAHSLYQQASAVGRADDDFSAVLEALLAGDDKQ